MSTIEYVRTRMRVSGMSYDPPRVLAQDPLFDAFRWKSIIRDVAKKHGLSVAELIGPARSRWIAWPRFEAAHQLRTELGWSLPQIGRRLGDRDHTTALNMLRRYEEPAVRGWLCANAVRVKLGAKAP